MGGSAVVTPAGLAPLHGSALQSSNRRVRDTISSVLNASIILAGLVAVEALFNFLNRNVLGGLVTLMLAFIPACGWYGALRRSPSMLRAFYLSNAASALCYLAGVAMLVGVMIPSVRCACDPLCQQPGNGVAAPGVQLSGLPDEEPLQFHGVDARTETVPDVATALLPAEYDSLCSRVAVAGLYASAVLSIAAAALHAYGFVLGRRLYKASSSPVRSPSAAVLPSSAAPASGPVSAPGPRRHSDARLMRQSPGSGRGLGSGLYQRTAMDVETASWRAAVASPSVAFSGPASGSSVRSSSGADGLC